MTVPSGWRHYALGVALGFLPCGLLYGALAAAAAAGAAVSGAFAMIASLPRLLSYEATFMLVGLANGRRTPPS